MRKAFSCRHTGSIVCGCCCSSRQQQIRGVCRVSLSSIDTGLGGHVVGGDDRETAPGFEFSATGHLTNHLGIEGDFDGHFKHQTFTFPSASMEDISLKSFNFMGGPHYRFSPRGKVTLFTRALFGANHLSASDGTINSATFSDLPHTQISAGYTLFCCWRVILRMTLKALANSSPGLLQPWDLCSQRTVTLKALAKWLPGRLRELLQSSRVMRVVLDSQGCGNPGLELANAFGVTTVSTCCCFLVALPISCRRIFETSPTPLMKFALWRR